MKPIESDDSQPTADDALEDWRDIIPEDVAELENRIKARQHIRGIENE